MPSKKKKYNARFPAGRIKKIMQTDEEVGKVAQAVPVIISRTLELFVESLLTKSMEITLSRNAKTLTPSHMKQCILSESRFDFLKDLVKSIPDASVQEDNENNAMFEANLIKEDSERSNSSDVVLPTSCGPETKLEPMKAEFIANFYTEQQGSSRTPVIQYGPKITKEVLQEEAKTKSFELKSDDGGSEAHINIDCNSVPIPPLVAIQNRGRNEVLMNLVTNCDTVPPLIPISHTTYGHNSEDNLCIDEDYDN